MYGTIPKKSKSPKPDPQVEMQPLMTDQYSDKSFTPEVPSTFSAFKLAAVVSTIAIILVIGIAVSSRYELNIAKNHYLNYI